MSSHSMLPVSLALLHKTRCVIITNLSRMLALVFMRDS